MTQTRTELIIQMVTALITVFAPLLYFYLPDRSAEIDVWVELAQAFVAIISVVALNWGVATFVKTRSQERMVIQSLIAPSVNDGKVESNGAEFME